MKDKTYEEWLAKSRDVSPPASLVDQVMSHVAVLERERREIWWLCLIQWIERSRTARWAVCGGALAIGGLPFGFLAYVAQSGAF